MKPLEDLIRQYVQRIDADDQPKAAESLVLIRDLLKTYECYRNDYADAIEIAREQCTNELEIDDEPYLSPSDEGTWVSAWIWVGP
jgi:hypothetical protein